MEAMGLNSSIDPAFWRIIEIRTLIEIMDKIFTEYNKVYALILSWNISDFIKND